MNEPVQTSQEMRPAQAQAQQRRVAAGGFNWFRFWVRSVIAIVIFNIVAAIVTWYFILPRLHPGMQ